MVLRLIPYLAIFSGFLLNNAMASTFGSGEDAAISSLTPQHQRSLMPLEIHSFNEVSKLLSQQNIEVDSETLVIFDFDETIAQRIYKLPVEGRTQEVRFLGGPDLGRTYKNFLVRANDHLPRQNYIPFVSMADVHAFFPSAFQKEEGWRERLSYELLEGEELIPVVSHMREQGACLKICSGLHIDRFKRNLLERTFDQLQFVSKDFYTAGASKADTIATIQRDLNTTRIMPINKIILFDNSLSTVTQFLEDALDIMPETEAIGIHYRYYESQISVENLVDEFNLLMQYYGPAPVFNRITLGRL